MTAQGTEVPVERLRPGHIVGASGARTILSDGIDHGTYTSFVVRYINGVQRIESWDAGSTVLVIGRDRTSSRHATGLHIVP
jgi:hypothetical protein